MTKEELGKLQTLILEHRTIEKSLQSLPLVYDSVKGSRHSMPYDVISMPIVGVDTKKAKDLRERYQRNMNAIKKEIDRLEDFLETVDDPHLRLILRLKYREGRTDECIACEVGYSRETINRKINNFLEKK